MFVFVLDQDFSPDCPPNKKLIPFTTEYMDLAMELHNKYRNELALGRVSGYHKAARMATLVSEFFAILVNICRNSNE